MSVPLVVHLFNLHGDFPMPLCHQQGAQQITWKYEHSTEEFGFLFGIYDLRLSLPYTIYRGAKFIHLHPKFGGFLNDIAVIKLDRKIAFNFYIRPICLPEKVDVEVSSISNCMFCGWGWTNPGE
uniref:Peptidase S1 domain-containing protein n=1 Tax=Romanomermis culicivorax TaxID=13658 RepID=A0A915JZZ3_ROMCU